MTDDNKALMALMDLVLAMVDNAPVSTQTNSRVRAERREVEGWRETLYLMSTEANRRRLEAAVKQKAAMEMDVASYARPEAATGQRGAGQYVYEAKAARAAVEATERRLRAWQGLDPIEADDSRVTDGHQCCGGKPDCGCSRSVGG